MASPSKGVRQRKPVVELSDTTAAEPDTASDDIRPTPVNPWTPLELIRIFVFAVYFLVSCLFIHAAQFIGAPLYLYDKGFYYSWQAVVKGHFGMLLTTMTWWFAPTLVRISGDASMQGQLHKTPDGRLECDFPERLVLISNHQLYTDWLYLWWISYTAGHHGHIYIILKQSLKWIPVVGTGMQMFSFIFMARKWANDKDRIAYRLQKLCEEKQEYDKKYHDPMWLLMFPEGTNLSANTRRKSAAWSEKSGTPDLKHAVLPRSTGLQFCLDQVKSTVEYVYDCTIAYETIPEGQYGQDIFTLRSVYFQGKPPKSVNMHWRRFKIADIPVDDEAAMQRWTLERWREKDQLLETFKTTGKFPGELEAVTIEKKEKPKPKPAPTTPATGDAAPDAAATAATTEVAEAEEPPAKPYIDTKMQPKRFYESFELFVPVITAVLVYRNIVRVITMMIDRRKHGKRWDFGEYPG